MLGQLTDCCTSATDLLMNRLAVSDAVPDIQIAKSQAKMVIKDLTGAVCKTFVTPFDREDLQAFAYYLYRIIKIIDKINQRLNYRPIDFELFKPQIVILQAQAVEMQALLKLLTASKNAQVVSEKVERINELEYQSDQYFHEALKRLYQASAPEDIRDFILQKDLLQHFDKVADTYRDAANLALQIVLKHS